MAFTRDPIHFAISYCTASGSEDLISLVVAFRVKTNHARVSTLSPLERVHHYVVYGRSSIYRVVVPSCLPDRCASILTLAYHFRGMERSRVLRSLDDKKILRCMQQSASCESSHYLVGFLLTCRLYLDLLVKTPGKLFRGQRRLQIETRQLPPVGNATSTTLIGPKSSLVG